MELLAESCGYNMFAEYIKIAAKTVAIVAGTAIILAFLGSLDMPTFNTDLLVTAIGKGKAILEYYIGDFIPLFNIGLILLGIRFVIIPGTKLALIAYKFIVKVNE